jgi:hypothetical protein
VEKQQNSRRTSPRNPTWTDPGWNLRLRGEKQATEPPELYVVYKIEKLFAVTYCRAYVILSSLKPVRISDITVKNVESVVYYE